MLCEVEFRFRTHSGTLYQVEWQTHAGYLVCRVLDATSPNWGMAEREAVCAADEFSHPQEGERWVARYDGRQVLSTSPVVDVFYPRRSVA